MIELSSTHQAAKHAIEFYIATPLDQFHATPKNGMMIAIGAPTMQNLGQFQNLTPSTKNNVLRQLSFEYRGA